MSTYHEQMAAKWVSRRGREWLKHNEDARVRHSLPFPGGYLSVDREDPNECWTWRLEAFEYHPQGIERTLKEAKRAAEKDLEAYLRYVNRKDLTP